MWDTSPRQPGSGQGASQAPPGMGAAAAPPGASGFRPQTRAQEEQGFLQANDGTIVLTGRAMTGGNRSTRGGSSSGCVLM